MGDGESRPPLPDREAETFLIRHEQQAEVGTRWRGVGSLRARKKVETVRVDESLPVDVERLDSERVPANENDSGRIETLADGSLSIPVYEEELVVTKRTVLRERVIIRKEVVTERQRIEVNLGREHVELETDGDVELHDDR